MKGKGIVPQRAKSIVAFSVLFPLAMLTACSSYNSVVGSDINSGTAVAGTLAETASDPTARLIACLNAHNVATKINQQNGGQVMVDVGAPNSRVWIENLETYQQTWDAEVAGVALSDIVAVGGTGTTSDGLWDGSPIFFGFTNAAALASADPLLYEAYSACETEVPEFSQPESPRNTAEESLWWDKLQQQGIEIGLAFSRCARDNGWAEIGDPSADWSFDRSHNYWWWGAEAQIARSVFIPVDFGIDAMKALLAQCYDPTSGFPRAINSDGTSMPGPMLTLAFEDQVPWAVDGATATLNPALEEYTPLTLFVLGTGGRFSSSHTFPGGADRWETAWTPSD